MTEAELGFPVMPAFKNSPPLTPTTHQRRRRPFQLWALNQHEGQPAVCQLLVFSQANTMAFKRKS